MDAIECTHCRVLMTGWRAPGSTVQYWQCPFCARTHSSPYGEVLRAGAGARVVKARPPGAAPRAVPVASPADVSLTLLKARANRWFARLRAEEQRAPARAAAPPPAEAGARAAGRGAPRIPGA